MLISTRCPCHVILDRLRKSIHSISDPMADIRAADLEYKTGSSRLNLGGLGFGLEIANQLATLFSRE